MRSSDAPFRRDLGDLEAGKLVKVGANTEYLVSSDISEEGLFANPLPDGEMLQAEGPAGGVFREYLASEYDTGHDFLSLDGITKRPYGDQSYLKSASGYWEVQLAAGQSGTGFEFEAPASDEMFFAVNAVATSGSTYQSFRLATSLGGDEGIEIWFANAATGAELFKVKNTPWTVTSIGSIGSGDVVNARYLIDVSGGLTATVKVEANYSNNLPASWDQSHDITSTDGIWVIDPKFYSSGSGGSVTGRINALAWGDADALAGIGVGPHNLIGLSTNGVEVGDDGLPLELVGSSATLNAEGLLTLANGVRVLSGDGVPTAGDIPTGRVTVWWDETNSDLYLYYNNSGTLVGGKINA